MRTLARTLPRELDDQLSAAEREVISSLSERALHLLERHTPALSAAEPIGIFLLLRSSDGEVRGCVGTTKAEGTIAALLPLLAGEAALLDPRHPPVDPAELEALRLELWILPEPPRRILDASSVDPTRDVLRIRRDLRSATFLPDVAIERGWSAKVSLSYACRKAGLLAHAWREEATEVLAFRSLYLHESGEAQRGPAPT